MRFFGVEGQAKLSAAHIAVVGVGGLGTHVVQQLALLGVGALTLIDHERLTTSNLNRYVGVVPGDVGQLKVDLAARLAQAINPDIVVKTIPHPLASRASFAAIRRCDVVTGCLDSEGARLVLTELASASDTPYFDLATDIDPTAKTYGGRVVCSVRGLGCLVCREVIDCTEAGRDLAGADGRRAHAAIYGVPVDQLEEVGPAVVSLNGVVASLGVTEMLVYLTGLRPPKPVLTYRGDLGSVRSSIDAAPDSCHYCHSIRGDWEGAAVERYLALEAQPPA